MRSLLQQSWESTRRFLTNRWTGSLQSCRKRCRKTVKSDATQVVFLEGGELDPEIGVKVSWSKGPAPLSHQQLRCCESKISDTLIKSCICIIQVMSIIIERTKDDSKESETFREQLKSRSDEFAEQMLEQHFGALIGWEWKSFVFLAFYPQSYQYPFRWLKDAERKLDAGDIEGLRQEERRVSNIIQTFSADWKKSLDLINGLASNLFICHIRVFLRWNNDLLSEPEIRDWYPATEPNTTSTVLSQVRYQQFYDKMVSWSPCFGSIVNYNWWWFWMSPQIQPCTWCAPPLANTCSGAADQHSPADGWG